MTQEIERKFVPRSIPEIAAHSEGVALRQGYIAEDADVSVRLRISPDGAVLTVKAGTGRSRTEVELRLRPDEVDALWPYTDGRRIDKIRYRVDLDDHHVAEIDVYDGDLGGLCTVEVEFDSQDAAERFEPPAWFGAEVTGIAAWTNAALSRRGRPS